MEDTVEIVENVSRVCGDIVRFAAGATACLLWKSDAMPVALISASDRSVVLMGLAT